MADNNEIHAVTCRNLWQVFGVNAKSALSEALSRSGNDATSAATDLRTQGLIPAVQDVSFDVHAGELFVIMGLSGSGKSTLVRCISQLLPGTSGEVLIDGENIVGARKKRLTELRRNKLGMVFQHFGLFPHMTVLQNVTYPLKVQGVSRSERNSRAMQMIELVELQGREESFPRQLSGGQRQRVGIARSLAVNPDIWMLDEPFSALDPLIRRQLQTEFLKIQKSLKKSVLFITHDITEALKLADRIAIMRDGKIVQIGTPTEIILNPVDDYVREFSKDVAKGQHAQVASVMQSHTNEVGPDDPGLTTTMTLDKALALCMELYERVPVHDETGNIVGNVQPSALSAALQVNITGTESTSKE